ESYHTLGACGRSDHSPCGLPRIAQLMADGGSEAHEAGRPHDEMHKSLRDTRRRIRSPPSGYGDEPGRELKVPRPRSIPHEALDKAYVRIAIPVRVTRESVRVRCPGSIPGSNRCRPRPATAGMT